MCDLCSLQIGEMFLGDVFVGMTGVDKDKALAQVRCTLLLILRNIITPVLLANGIMHRRVMSM